jgi:hypothetical protein
MAWRTLPDAEYLHQCFSYDPDAGTLTWRWRPREHFPTDREYMRWNSAWRSRRAGATSGGGHIMVKINKRLYGAHRIIWKMITGEDPPDQLDHINRNRIDNRFENLRLATHSQNVSNKSRYRNNTSGAKGVRIQNLSYPHPYQARIRVNGNLIHIGSFSTIEDARDAYAAAAKHYFGEFWSDGV